MEPQKLLEIKQYLFCEYNGEEEIYVKMKMYLDDQCSIEELYNFLDQKNLIYPSSGCRGFDDDELTITEDDLNDLIKNKVLEISKDKNGEL